MDEQKQKKLYGEDALNKIYQRKLIVEAMENSPREMDNQDLNILQQVDGGLDIGSNLAKLFVKGLKFIPGLSEALNIWDLGIDIFGMSKDAIIDMIKKGEKTAKIENNNFLKELQYTWLEEDITELKNLEGFDEAFDKECINKKLSETQKEFNEYHNKRNDLLKQLKDWAI